MAKKKTEKPISQTPLSVPGSNDWDFDSLEEKIRGEEILLEAEQKLAKEESEVKKKLDSSELDRRLEALRQKIKPKGR